MNTRGIVAGRLTRYLYESRMAFLFAILAVVVVVAAFGVRARTELGCAARSIATSSDRCAAAEEAEQASGGINLVFQPGP